MRTLASFGLLFLALSCASPGTLGSSGTGSPPVEATALDGTPLTRLAPTGERRLHYLGQLAAARARWEERAEELDAVWVGRHLGYLGRYQEALDWFTARLRDFPGSVRLLRHRGHRYISVRRFDDAVLDLERAWTLAQGTADEVEPDGAPNELGIPRSTTHTNVLYHLALARYLRGEWGAAAAAWRLCADLAPNDDMLVAALNWQVHAERRAGDEDAARRALERVRPEMDVIENHTYHRLLLLQKGELTPDEVLGPEADGIQNATAAYGVGAWAWCEGDRARAKKTWTRIVAETPWNAFGHIAAEAELYR